MGAWEKIVKTSDQKGVTPRAYKELLQINNKKTPKKTEKVDETQEKATDVPKEIPMTNVEML